MIDSPSDLSIAMLTLPHEDPLEHAQLWSDWTSAYPDSSLIERDYMEQAFTALVEKRRIKQARATLRTQKVRTAMLDWERAQEDTVAYWLDQFNHHCLSALVGLLRSAAGCRWTIEYWSKLALKLQADGTWFGQDRLGAIQLQGKSACVEHLYHSEEAFTTWIDCLACQPNPKQSHVDRILDRKIIPQALQDRGLTLWPRDPGECRARLRSLVDGELLSLKALEQTLRVQYEEPARAEAQVMALASVTPEEMQLLRAEQIHERSYQRAVAALQSARKQTAASRAPAAAARDESPLVASPAVAAPGAPHPTPPSPDRTDL